MKDLNPFNIQRFNNSLLVEYACQGKKFSKYCRGYTQGTKGRLTIMKIKGDPEIFFLLKTLMDRTGKTAVRFEMVGMD